MARPPPCRYECIHDEFTNDAWGDATFDFTPEGMCKFDQNFFESQVSMSTFMGDPQGSYVPDADMDCGAAVEECGNKVAICGALRTVDGEPMCEWDAATQGCWGHMPSIEEECKRLDDDWNCQQSPVCRFAEVEVFDEREDFINFAEDGEMEIDIDESDIGCTNEVVDWCRYLTNEQDCNGMDDHACVSVTVSAKSNGTVDADDLPKMCVPLNKCQRGRSKKECESTSEFTELGCEWDDGGRMCHHNTNSSAAMITDCESLSPGQKMENAPPRELATKVLQCTGKRDKTSCETRDDEDAVRKGECRWVKSDKQRWCVKSNDPKYQDAGYYDGDECVRVNLGVDDPMLNGEYLATKCVAYPHCVIVQKPESQFCTFADACFGKDGDTCNELSDCTWDSEEDVCVVLDDDVISSGCENSKTAKDCSDNNNGKCEWDEDEKQCEETVSVDCYNFYNKDACKARKDNTKELCKWIDFSDDFKPDAGDGEDGGPKDADADEGVDRAFIDTSACWGVTCDDDEVATDLKDCTMTEDLLDKESCRNKCKLIRGCDWVENDFNSEEQPGMCAALDNQDESLAAGGEEIDEADNCLAKTERTACVSTFDPDHGALCVWLDVEDSQLKTDGGFSVKKCQPSGRCNKATRIACEREGCNWVEQRGELDFGAEDMDGPEEDEGGATGLAGVCRTKPSDALRQFKSINGTTAIYLDENQLARNLSCVPLDIFEGYAEWIPPSSEETGGDQGAGGGGEEPGGVGDDGEGGYYQSWNDATELEEDIKKDKDWDEGSEPTDKDEGSAPTDEGPKIDWGEDDWGGIDEEGDAEDAGKDAGKDGDKDEGSKDEFADKYMEELKEDIANGDYNPKATPPPSSTQGGGSPGGGPPASSTNAAGTTAAGADASSTNAAGTTAAGADASSTAAAQSDGGDRCVMAAASARTGRVWFAAAARPAPSRDCRCRAPQPSSRTNAAPAVPLP